MPVGLCGTSKSGNFQPNNSTVRKMFVGASFAASEMVEQFGFVHVGLSVQWSRANLSRRDQQRNPWRPHSTPPEVREEAKLGKRASPSSFWIAGWSPLSFDESQLVAATRPPDADNGLQHDCFRVEGDHDRQGKHGDFSMKLLVSAALLLSLFGTASADSVVNMGKLRLADAATDACFASCASRSDACKRACPVTLNLPCLSSCDAQAQYCRQGCQR